jgi:hypothetical protein
LWLFSIEQYYSDYFPQMHEESSAFTAMISCHLGPTPMNWFRQFGLECDRDVVAKSWPTFKGAVRQRFLPPDHEFLLRERLFAIQQTGSIQDYIFLFRRHLDSMSTLYV